MSVNVQLRFTPAMLMKYVEAHLTRILLRHFKGANLEGGVM